MLPTLLHNRLDYLLVVARLQKPPFYLVVEIICVILGDGVIKLYVFSILAFVMAKGSNNPRGKTSDASKPYDVSNVSKKTMNSRAKVYAHGGRWSAMVDL